MLLCSISPVTPVTEKLALMQQVGHKFQLTGSRFFGTSTEKSDWDFFTQDSPGVRLWLTTNGFVDSTGGTGYVDDGLCVDVFTFVGEHERFNPSQYIQVQLVKDFSLKQKIQEQLSRMYPTFTRDKNLARAIWKGAYEFYSMGHNDGYQSGVKNGHELTTLVLS